MKDEYVKDDNIKEYKTIKVDENIYGDLKKILEDLDNQKTNCKC